MAYTYKNELASVKKYYEGDPMQKRFSALITGETNAGKTFLLRTARMPIHIDSFDPGGTKGLRDYIRAGKIVADTSWETDDPFEPTAFAEWMKAVDRRITYKYFEQFGTYCLDSATTWGEAVMAYGLGLKNRAGEAPRHNHDYMPAKVHMTNYIRKLMNLPCDFILTGHLREMTTLLSIDTKTGIKREETKYRFLTVGQAVVTIPLLFDEIYVLIGEKSSSGVRRKMLIDSLGEYVARSRLRADGKLDAIEDPDIKKILKKIGLPWEDKPMLEDN